MGLCTPTDLSLDLETAINFALNQNRELLNAGRGLQYTHLEVDEQEEEFALQIIPRGKMEFRGVGNQTSYSLGMKKKMNWGTTVSLNASQIRNKNTSNNHEYTGRVRFEINQPLFRNAGRMINLEGLIKSKNQVKTAWRVLETSRADLIVDVIKIFERILQLERRLEIDAETFERLDKLNKITALREKQGRATRVDSLRMQLQRGEALSRIENNKEQLIITQQNFADLLGFEPDFSFTLLPASLLDISIPEYEEGVEIALSNRLDFAQIAQDAWDAERGKKIARKRIWPDLSLNVGYERFNESSNHDDSWNFDRNTWFIGFGAGSDFFRKREKAAFKQAKLTLEQATLDLEILRHRIRREVKQGLLAYRRIRSDLEIALKNKELADKRLRLAKRLFETGRGDNFSVTDAEEALHKSIDQLLQTQADASISSYLLLRTLGVLVDFPDELKVASIKND